MSDKRRDLLGVPLLDRVIEHNWDVQQQHVKCIQGVPGVSLYTETGTTTKGVVSSIGVQGFHIPGWGPRLQSHFN